MATLVLRLEAHMVDRDVWCDRCLLTTAARVVVTRRDDPTRTVMRIETCRRCRHTRRL